MYSTKEGSGYSFASATGWMALVLPDALDYRALYFLLFGRGIKLHRKIFSVIVYIIWKGLYQSKNKRFGITT